MTIDIISGESIQLALTSTTPYPVTYSWTLVTTGTITGAVAGTGNTIDQVIEGEGTIVYTITPTQTGAGCVGDPISVVINVFTITPFTFTAITEATVNTVYTSEGKVMGGSFLNQTISIIIGEYRINGGTWTNDDGVISNGDVLEVRGTSSTEAEESKNVATVTVGNYTTSFQVTTASSIGNEYQSEIFQRNNCSPGFGGTNVKYEIPADTYFAATLSEANDLALADITTNGQNYANTEGDCQSESGVSTLLIDYYDNDQNADLCLYCPTTGVTLENQIVSNRHLGSTTFHFLPSSETEAINCYLLASDDIGQPTLKRRFGVNLAKYIQDNPSIDTFEFVLRGRTSSSSKAITGAFAKRNVNQGYLAMTGSEGDYVPTVVGSSGSTTGYSNTIPTGGDSTVGISVGNVLLRLTYVVSTDTLTQASS